MNPFNVIWKEASDLLSEFGTDEVAQAGLQSLLQRLVLAFETNGTAWICGNGGSMADAMHFAEEWTGRFRNERRPYPARALASDPTHLSCVANDYGFDQVFARDLYAFGKPEDILILLSTSGNSANLLAANEVAQQKGMFSVAMVGKGGGKLAPLASLSIHYPGTTSDRIQELQMLSLHALIELAEKDLGHA